MNTRTPPHDSRFVIFDYGLRTTDYGLTGDYGLWTIDLLSSSNEFTVHRRNALSHTLKTKRLSHTLLGLTPQPTRGLAIVQ